MTAGKTISKPVIMIDFGGVYFHSATMPVTKKFSKKFGIPRKKIDGALMGSNWTEHAEGRSDEETYWYSVSEKLGISKKQMQELRKAWYSYSIPQTGMVNLVRRLKKKYKVVVLSSIIVGWVEVLEKKYKISNEFHEQHYSYDHGIDKPSTEFFKSAAKRMKTRPENCIVIDDNKEFLTKIKKTGAKTILFKDARQLERELRKNGVKL